MCKFCTLFVNFFPFLLFPRPIIVYIIILCVNRQNHSTAGQRVRRMLFRRRGRHRHVHDAHSSVRVRVRVRETQIGQRPIVFSRPRHFPQHKASANRTALLVHRTRTGIHLLGFFKGNTHVVLHNQHQNFSVQMVV